MKKFKKKLREYAPYLIGFAAGVGATAVVLAGRKTQVDVNGIDGWRLGDDVYALDEDEVTLYQSLSVANEEKKPLVWKEGDIYMPDSLTMHLDNGEDKTL